MTKTVVGQVSDRGLSDRYPVNEDSFLVLDAPAQELEGRGKLYVVADGAGGPAAGPLASKLAVETLQDYYYSREWTGSPETMLKAAIGAANAEICRAALTPAGKPGMGSTVTALVILGDRAWVAQVGDSRCYLYDGGQLIQVTQDHSLVEEEVRQGKITREQARFSMNRGMTTRSLGRTAAVEVDIYSLPARDTDTFVLCTDGLHGTLDNDAIAESVATLAPQAAAEQLVDRVKQAGAPDNVTVVIVGGTGRVLRKPVRTEARRPITEVVPVVAEAPAAAAAEMEPPVPDEPAGRPFSWRPLFVAALTIAVLGLITLASVNTARRLLHHEDQPAAEEAVLRADSLLAEAEELYESKKAMTEFEQALDALAEARDLGTAGKWNAARRRADDAAGYARAIIVKVPTTIPADTAKSQVALARTAKLDVDAKLAGSLAQFPDAQASYRTAEADLTGAEQNLAAGRFDDAYDRALRARAGFRDVVDLARTKDTTNYEAQARNRVEQARNVKQQAMSLADEIKAARAGSDLEAGNRALKAAEADLKQGRWVPAQNRATDAMAAFDAALRKQAAAPKPVKPPAVKPPVAKPPAAKPVPEPPVEPATPQVDAQQAAAERAVNEARQAFGRAAQRVKELGTGAGLLEGIERGLQTAEQHLARQAWREAEAAARPEKARAEELLGRLEAQRRDRLAEQVRDALAAAGPAIYAIAPLSLTGQDAADRDRAVQLAAEARELLSASTSLEQALQKANEAKRLAEKVKAGH